MFAKFFLNQDVYQFGEESGSFMKWTHHVHTQFSQKVAVQGLQIGEEGSENRGTAP